MYVNRYSRIADPNEVINFINAHPFGTLVAMQNATGVPIASHIPFWLEQQGDDFFLLFHLAKANDLVDALVAGSKPLAIFQGPHAYISPSWYEKPNVPTWNYQAVHVYGTARPLTVAELESHVAQIMNTYESGFPKGRKFEDFSKKYVEAELKGIEGFAMKIEDVEAAYKLSQNRSAADYSNIVHELRKTGNETDRALASEMERIDNKRNQ